MAEKHIYQYEGRPRVLLNLKPDGPGGPHDDNVARSLGFRRALVPGEAVAEAMMPAIVARFGTRFMEGGWLSVKMIAATHVDEEVREIGASVEGSPDVLDLRLETSEGRLTCVVPGWSRWHRERHSLVCRGGRDSRRQHRPPGIDYWRGEPRFVVHPR